CWPLSRMRCGGPSAIRTRLAAKRADAAHVLRFGDSEGDSVSPTHSIDVIADRFLISRAVFDPAFEHIDRPGLIGTRVAGFNIRIQQDRPKIIRSEV
ncbi:hypothetical protein ACFFQG_26145, partial [Shinella granuli]|uniref:hypothetical protein n=1 Tax=Shinella granuli TaxID=323621 RepID=UPI0035EE1362